MKKHGNKKDYVLFLTESKIFSKILGNYDLSEAQKENVRCFFDFYSDGDRSGVWRKNVCIWIQYGLDEWIERRSKLTTLASNSLAWFILMYGEDVGLEKHKQFSATLGKRLPSSVEFWLEKGASEEEAKARVSSRQKEISKNKTFERKDSNRCKEFWTSRGFSEDEAKKQISILQRRDLDFFVSKYGPVIGPIRFSESKKNRKITWEYKDKLEHAVKTTPKNYNPIGQEITAINEFIRANNIPIKNCKYGQPKDQFWQMIPNVGFRRYDLAVFDGPDHKKLLYILEYHGPGHINFSDYTDELENEYITIMGKTLAHLGTYGQSYKNDLRKRKHILSTFPDVQYLVIWTEDLLNKRFKIDELLHKGKE